MSRAEIWRVSLIVDGQEVVEDITLEPPVRLAAVLAEVGAIKHAEAAGGRAVRATWSRFVGFVAPEERGDA